MSTASGASSPGLSVPKGGGATRGLGDGFTPDFNRGTSSYSIEIQVPKGYRDLAPSLALFSVGLVAGKPMADLAYVEDSAADVDLNVVSDGAGGIVEVQGTAEGAPVPRATFDALLDLALGAMPALRAAQDGALAQAGVELARLRA